MKKRVLSMLLSAAMALSLLTGCAGVPAASGSAGAADRIYLCTQTEFTGSKKKR